MRVEKVVSINPVGMLWLQSWGMRDFLVYTLGKMQIDDKSAFVNISILLIGYKVTIYENSIFNMVYVPYYWYWYIMQDFIRDRWDIMVLYDKGCTLYCLDSSFRLSAGLLRQATYTTTRMGIYSSLFEKFSV